MPTGFKSICTYPGCNTITRQGRCDKHRRTDERPQAHKRGYDYRWRKKRNQYIRDNPVCELQHKCNGDPAVDVDHITPIDRGGAVTDEKNLQALCRACHNWKTRVVDYGAQG